MIFYNWSACNWGSFHILLLPPIQDTKDCCHCTLSTMLQTFNQKSKLQSKLVLIPTYKLEIVERKFLLIIVIIRETFFLGPKNKH